MLQGGDSPRATVEAVSQSGNGNVNISLTGSLAPSIALDFVDIVGLEGVEEDMEVVVPGVPDALPK